MIDGNDSARVSAAHGGYSVLFLPGPCGWAICMVHVPRLSGPAETLLETREAVTAGRDDVCGGGETQPQPAVPGAGHRAPLLLTQAARTTSSDSVLNRI